MTRKRRSLRKSGHPGRAGAAAPDHRDQPPRHQHPRHEARKSPYEPPKIERLGSLRDLLAVKSGPGLDPSPVHPFAKK